MLELTNYAQQRASVAHVMSYTTTKARYLDLTKRNSTTHLMILQMSIQQRSRQCHGMEMVVLDSVFPFNIFQHKIIPLYQTVQKYSGVSKIILPLFFLYP